MPDDGLRVLPYGDRAVLVEVADLQEATAWAAGARAACEAGALAGVVAEIVPGARTVLLVAQPGIDAAALRRAAALITPSAPVARSDGLVEIPTVYDGEDLDAVASTAGMSVEEVIAAHTGQTWTVAFGGFAPGFGYLAAEDPRDRRLHVPRRSEARTRVPAGSVGLAGEFSGVYPRASPGGWQLIGRTDLVLFEAEREPAALLRPGVRVRFTEVGS